MGTEQKFTVVGGDDPTWVVTDVVPFVTEGGQFQAVGGEASGSVVMVVVVVPESVVCEMAKTCADDPLVESKTIASPST